MNRHLWPTLTLTFFTTLGNAQDGAVPSPAGSGYGIQGNVAWKRSQQEADLEKAALAARQKKAMMNSMASVAMKPPTITSAEQYLQFYKPVAEANAGAPGTGSSPVRRDAYVPEFDTAPVLTGRGEATPPPPAAPAPPVMSRTELPSKRGLFGFLKNRDEGQVEADLLPPPPASTYPETPAAPDVPAAPVAPLATPESNEAVAMATAGSEEKPSFLGRLFGRGKDTEPSSVPDPTLSGPPASLPAAAEMTPQVVESSERVGIPSPPGFNAPPAPQPEAPEPRIAKPAPQPEEPVSRPVAPEPKPAIAERKPAAPEPKPAAPDSKPTAVEPKPAAPAPASGSSIFVNRPSVATMGTAIVMEEVQASVDGVLVRLYEGNRVELLDRQGSLAKIRLSDGREGTVPANTLGQ